jgi:hypothetical protein
MTAGGTDRTSSYNFGNQTPRDPLSRFRFLFLKHPTFSPLLDQNDQSICLYSKWITSANRDGSSIFLKILWNRFCFPP